MDRSQEDEKEGVLGVCVHLSAVLANWKAAQLKTLGRKLCDINIFQRVKPNDSGGPVFF